MQRKTVAELNVLRSRKSITRVYKGQSISGDVSPPYEGVLRCLMKSYHLKKNYSLR